MISMLLYALCGICCVLVAIKEFGNTNLCVIALSCSTVLFRTVSQEIDKMLQAKNDKHCIYCKRICKGLLQCVFYGKPKE